MVGLLLFLLKVFSLTSLIEFRKLSFHFSAIATQKQVCLCRYKRILVVIEVLFAISCAFECRPIFDAQRLSGDKVILHVLLNLLCVVFVSISVSWFDILMRCSVYSRSSGDSRNRIISRMFLVTFDVISLCYGLAQMLPLSFDLLQPWVYVVSVVDVRNCELAQFLLVNVSVRCGRWVHVSTVSVTLLALSLFAHSRLMFVLDYHILPSDGFSFFA